MSDFAILQGLISNMFSDSAQTSWQDALRSQIGDMINATIAERSNPMGAALTGQIRSDAGVLRQASKNVKEGQSMMDMAASATDNISGLLASAKKLADAYSATSDTTLQAQYQAQYNSIKSNIDNVIKSTTYNGISLLDGNAWSSDKRVNVASDQNSGSVEIYADNSGFPLAFSNMRTAISSPLSGINLSDSTASAALDQLSSSAGLMSGIYNSRSSSLKEQANSLSRQATVLDMAAFSQASSGNSSTNIKDLLVDLAGKNTGNIVSKSS